MAKNVSSTVSVSSSDNAGLTASLTSNESVDIGGNNIGLQVTPTSASALAVPVAGLSTYSGVFALKNASIVDGEIIDIYQDGVTCSVLIGPIYPGEIMKFRPAAALGCKSRAGTPELQVLPCEL